MKHKIFKSTFIGVSFLSLIGGLFSLNHSSTIAKAEEPSWTYESNFPTARTNLSSEWQNGFYGPAEVTYLENGALHISNTTSGIKSVLYKNELDYTNFMVTADAKMTQVSDSGNNAVIGFALSASKKNVTGANHSTQITYIYVAASGSVYLESYFSELNTDYANTTYVPYDAGKQNFTVSWGVSKKTLSAELLSSLKAGNFLNFKMTINGRNITFSVEDQQMLNFSLDAGMDNYRAFGLMSRGTYTQAAYKNIKILDYTELANRPNLKIGILSDVHIGANASNATYFRQVLQNYKSSKIDLLIVNGDIAHHKEPRAHNQGANAITNQQEFADILNEVLLDLV